MGEKAERQGRMATLQVLLLAALALGLLGTLVELVLIEHYEDPWQLAPIILVGSALVVVAWHVARPHPASIQLLQIVMVLIMASGALGVWFHFRGAAEFQYEMDPSQDAWTVFTKVLRVKAPPVLAPGLMTHLGLLGLIYAYYYRAVATAEVTVARRHK